MTGHIDVAPTVLELAGVNVNDIDLDGTPITFPLLDEYDYKRNVLARSETTHVEFWGPFRQEWHYSNVSTLR